MPCCQLWMYSQPSRRYCCECHFGQPMFHKAFCLVALLLFASSSLHQERHPPPMSLVPRSVPSYRPSVSRSVPTPVQGPEKMAKKKRTGQEAQCPSNKKPPPKKNLRCAGGWAWLRWLHLEWRLRRHAALILRLSGWHADVWQPHAAASSD